MNLFVIFRFTKVITITLIYTLRKMKGNNRPLCLFNFANELNKSNSTEVNLTFNEFLRLCYEFPKYLQILIQN